MNAKTEHRRTWKEIYVSREVKIKINGIGFLPKKIQAERGNNKEEKKNGDESKCR